MESAWQIPGNIIKPLIGRVNAAAATAVPRPSDSLAYLQQSKWKRGGDKRKMLDDVNK